MVRWAYEMFRKSVIFGPDSIFGLRVEIGCVHGWLVSFCWLLGWKKPETFFSLFPPKHQYQLPYQRPGLYNFLNLLGWDGCQEQALTEQTTR